MTNKHLTEAESLELISSMIQDSRARLARNSGTPFLIWGYTTIAVSLFNALTLYLRWSHSWAWSWFAIPIIGWIGMLLFNKTEPSARNYIDRVISIIWATTGISFLWYFIGAAIYGSSIAYLTILVMGVGTVITGLILKNKATTTCGCGAMLASLIFPAIHIISTMDILSPTLTSSIIEFWRWGEKVIFAAIFFCMMVVPGHILNHKYNSKADSLCSKS